MKVLIAGDFCQSYRVDEMLTNSNYNMFDLVKPIINSCDIRIVNFEFPIVSDNSSPIDKVGPVLGGTHASIDALLSAGFNVCTLANNHILDQGEMSCLDTKETLEKSGIKTVGVGKNIQDASKILYIRINEQTLAIINCCEHEFSVATETTVGANPLNVVKQFYAINEAKSKADYVLVIVHAGIEHYQLPTPRMKENYRFFIDAGADAVVNHHQHCYSGYEIYHDRPIFYGIGNFLFDNPRLRNNIWNEGYMVELDFSQLGVEYKIYPYNQCNETPIVELLNDDANESFINRIHELNSIILSDTVLSTTLDSYIEINSKFILSSFTPWTNRIFIAAFVRGLLPSFLSKKQKKHIKSRIMCESHFDITLRELSKKK